MKYCVCIVQLQVAPNGLFINQFMRVQKSNNIYSANKIDKVQ